MDAEGRTYGEQLAAMLAAAAQELRQLSARAHRLTGADLHTVLPLVDALTAVAAAGRFTIAAEAEERGEVAASLAGTLAQWVSERCPSLEMREAGQVAKAVRELGTPTLSVAREAVAAGRISVASGCVVASEWRQLLPLVEPAAHDAVVAGLVAIGESDGCPGVRAVRPALLARYGLGEQLQEIEDRHRGLTVLSCGHDIGGAITEYRMRLDPEARAVVEAAINTLSAPAGTDGARDVRTVDQRRGDALVAVCRRATAISPTRTPSTLKATVIVTIPLADLRDRTPPGVLVGGLDGGTPLGPETVRRLACDGAVIPACSILPASCCGSAAPDGSSRPPRSGGSGCETGIARSLAAPPRPPGVTLITSGTGSTAELPTSTTPPCSANGTTRSFTATGFPPR